MTFIAAKCPNCAGDIQVPDDRDSVKCMYCGSDIVVRDAIKAAAGGVNIENVLMLANAAEGSQNWAEAYKYYSTVLEHEPENTDAWIGKGINAVFGKMDHADFIAKNCFKNALDFASDLSNIRDAIKNRIIKNIKARGNIQTLSELDQLTYNLNHRFYALILEVDQDYIPGLIVKGDQELSGRKELAEGIANYRDLNAISYYQKAIDISQHDRRVLQLIIQHASVSFNWVGISIDKQFPVSRVLDERREIIDFIHKINPTDRPIEENILGNMNRLYSSVKSPAEESEKKTYHQLLSEVQRFNTKYSSLKTPPNLKSGCFISTAAYGSPMAAEVLLLRKFRDNHLETNPFGSAIVKAYYRISPPIARLVSKSDLLKSITRQLLKPVIAITKACSRGNNR